MAAPSFIQEAETTYNSAASKTTASFSVLAGDVLSAYCIVEGNPAGATAAPTISGGSLTWTPQQDVNVDDYTRVIAWTATVDTNKSMTVTIDDPGSTSNFFGGNVLTWRGSDGVGASSKTNVLSGAPSLGLTTGQDNSAIVVVIGDWTASDGTSRTWRSVNGSAATESTYFRDSSHYTAYGGYHPDAGTAGAKTVGLSAPGSLKYSIVAVEIKGAAGGTGWTKNIDDGIAGTDVVTKTPGPHIADPIGATDSRTTAWVAKLTVADPLAGTDTAAKAPTHPIADSGALTDATTKTAGHSVADPAGLTDSNAKTATHPIADQAGLTDSPVRVWTAKLPLADAGTLTDNVSTGGATNYTKNIDDGITATDTVTHAWVAKLTVADPIAATDATSKAPKINRADPIAATDTRTAVWHATLPIADNAALQDATSRQWAAHQTLADTATLTDQSGPTTPATRWLITPASRWEPGTGTRWDIDPSTRWPPAT